MHTDPLPVREPAVGQTDQRPAQEELVAGRMDSGSIAEEQAGNQSRVLGHLRTKEQPLRGHHNFEQGGNRTVESVRW